MTKPFTADNGKTYKIIDEVHDQLVSAFGRHFPTKDDAHARRLALLQKSQAKIDQLTESGALLKMLEAGEELPETLSSDELQTLRACDTACNLHSAARWLNGRAPEDFFGPDATLCQVHGNRHVLDCGCIIQYGFDHHIASSNNRIASEKHKELMEPVIAAVKVGKHTPDSYEAAVASVNEQVSKLRETLPTYPHIEHYPQKVCEDHRHLMGDFKEHHRVALAEHRARNQ